MTEELKVIPAQYYLTTNEAGEHLRISPRTLQNMRAMDTGPVFRKHGKRVFYRLQDLIAWSEANANATIPSEVL
ncbi:MAG: helix-turn-helix domain-containing protein [Aliivibrio sp.]|uniref:helix-turn-helix domain-containing protein n=1 Tax=Aliivibrio sp. TaxID=1872443 RepID=UPI001A5521F5|nr:helix-turn-helix domain-containing protein [Aliivibrio sp.]